MFNFAPNLRSLFVFVGFSIEISDLFGIGSINLIFQKVICLIQLTGKY